MKKILFAFLFVILGFSLTTGGVVLLSGCSSSQTENGGGGEILRLRKMKTKKQKTSMKAKE